MALRFRSFAKPDLLKEIDSANLFALLRPYSDFFQNKGFLLTDAAEIDHLSLAGILAQPDEYMDAGLVEALHLIDNFSGHDQFDTLFGLAKQVGVEPDAEDTAPDLAIRIYLKSPDSLDRKDKERLFEKRKSFDCYRAAGSAKACAVGDLPNDLSPIEIQLGAYFEGKKRGHGCRLHKRYSSTECQFLIEHGQSCRREPSRIGEKSTSTFFRPEKTDIVIYDFARNELRVNAENYSDGREYREAFGKHLFGNPALFASVEKYTLKPLQVLQEQALSCRDVVGIENVRLTEVEYAWEGAFDHVEIHRAADVFKALTLVGRSIDESVQIKSAVFKIKFEGEKRPRSAKIRAGNRSGYNRGEESSLIETWLIARGFVISAPTEEVADPEPVMALV